MVDKVPDIETFTAKIAELHTKGVSPYGRYGFSVPTFMGQMPQYTAWTESWEEFFTMSMQQLMTIIEESQGPDVELKMLFEQIVSKVIPRLLRPLETGVDAVTGEPILYDAACLYAHNEWDLAPWRLVRHKIGKPFMEAYFRHFPIAEPKEDQEDRSILYCLRWDMKGMVIYPGDIRYRTYCVDAMRTLIAKFPEGFEG
ncbi:hypothetical protein JMJ35_001071 [Cladonia borealis]|uniref:Uncharacterized protein n=1 Tax=Cladonia borealis TaxID=184061 RepID=A0AA39R7W0_9LECA|nr:hypothetical protein JMJ35_001071 [Cladonia borealis]